MGPKTALSVGSRGAGLQQKSKLLCFFSILLNDCLISWETIWFSLDMHLKPISPFEFIKNVLFCQFKDKIHILACIYEVIYLPGTFHSLPEILFCWTHYSFQVGQSLGDWCYNLSQTAPFLAFRSTLSPDGPITG